MIPGSRFNRKSELYFGLNELAADGSFTSDYRAAIRLVPPPGTQSAKVPVSLTL